MSYSTRGVSLPFWLAIPVGLCVVVGWLIYGLVHGGLVACGWLWRKATENR